jgi:hypothetical protein
MALTTIASFREAHTAHIARARLEAEGIPAFVADEHLSSVQWFYSDAIGGVKIQVPGAFAERALEVVTADRSSDLARVRVARRPLVEICPGCGADGIERTSVPREPRPRRPSALRKLVVWSTRSKCRACGEVW